MLFRDWLWFKAQGLKKRLGIAGTQVSTTSRTAAATDDHRHLAQSDLGQLFFAHQGRPLMKWASYLDHYDRYFGPYRDRPVRMLEIGVAQGGSLELWRQYFGPEATVFGVDIDPECSTRADPPNHARIGSQADPAFLRSVIDEMGAPDIILDDGSHIASHQRASFQTLFPLLRVGGLYVIEDLHTAYWPGFFEGGYRRSGTAVGLVKRLIDDVHGWWHHEPAPWKEDIGGIHVHESIVFIEKRPNPEPVGLVR